jgi:hypothetical protein
MMRFAKRRRSGSSRILTAFKVVVAQLLRLLQAEPGEAPAAQAAAIGRRC